MAFGYSAGDALLLTQLAYRVVQNSRKACGEYDDLTREATSIHLVLGRLQHEIGISGSLISREWYSDELQSVAGGCEKILKKVDAILVKYNALNENERSVRKLWRSVRFGNGPMVDVEHLRAKLAYYVSALTLLLNMTSTGTMGRVERKMDEAGGDLREIRLAVNGITAHLIAGNKAEGSIFTTYSGDDKSVWREFRRELNREGFSSAVIHQHKRTIKAYIKELGDRGLLDDSDPAQNPSFKQPSCEELYQWRNNSEPEDEDFHLDRDFKREARPGSLTSTRQSQGHDENGTERLNLSSIHSVSERSGDDDQKNSSNQSVEATLRAQRGQEHMSHATRIEVENNTVSEDNHSSHDDLANDICKIEKQTGATRINAVSELVHAMIEKKGGLYILPPGLWHTFTIF